MINNMSNKTAIVNPSQRTKLMEPILTYGQCLGHKLKKQLDIDIGYAIGLLKKEDQNVNVYSHLRGILDKIILEKPPNPLENFEKYSRMLKRTYIYKQVNFERVFVDNINRNDCRINLQIFKRALIKQSLKQKRLDNIKADDLQNIDNSNQVQNIWEANYMFNKAGCGLPEDEVALISLTMNEMAQLNKFKYIRFWGKIFGLKKNYFIIECECTEEEINRKLWAGDQILNLLTDFEIEQDNIVPQDSMSTENILHKSKAAMSSVPDKPEINKTRPKDSYTSPATGLNIATTDSTVNYDDWTFLDEDSSIRLNSTKPSEKILPPEPFGIGANKNLYFVTNELNKKWIELGSVQPVHIVESRKIKRFFTGELYETVNSYPKFNGLEINYLRAQIARISSSTQIFPQGYYGTEIIDNNQDEITKNQSISVLSNSIKKNDVDSVRNENFKPIPNYNLINTNYWVHKNDQIGHSGVTGVTDESVESTIYVNSSDEMYLIADEENVGYNEHEDNFDQQDDRSPRNVKNDITIEGSPAWKGTLCSPFDTRNSPAMMKSHIWPGAYAVAYEYKMEFVYVGWAQKQEFTLYCSNLIGELKMNSSTKDNLTEMQDPIDNQNVKNMKQKFTKSSLNNTFSLKKYQKGYKGKEKIIKDYIYDY